MKTDYAAYGYRNVLREIEEAKAGLIYTFQEKFLPDVTGKVNVVELLNWLDQTLNDLELRFGNTCDWSATVEIAFNRHCQSLKNDLDIDDVIAFLDGLNEKKRQGLKLKLDPYLPKPHSFIKNVAIAIHPDYNFSNSPLPEDSKADPFFIGRVRDLKKFGKLLDSEVKKGVFLVTGYRGMGKTSFVNKSISAYSRKRAASKNSISVKTINLNLAQKDPSESDVLKLMVSHLHDFYISEQKAPKHLSKRFLKTSLTISIALLVSLLFGNYWAHLNQVLDGRSPWDLWNSLEPRHWLINGLRFLLLINVTFIIFLLTVMVVRALNRKYADITLPRPIIERLYTRCYASNMVEKGQQQELAIDKIGAKFSGSYERETMSYPIASSKEIEFELDKFLRAIKKEGLYEFIFVFDELDKIEPAAVTTDYVDEEERTKGKYESTYLQQIRQRKQSVMNLIAGLKNFLTTAQARFVFIAGREMFDATLADVADRQSSISSIFNYVFYIESFLKENMEQDSIKSSLSSCIENYLIYVLFGKEVAYAGESSLADLLFERYTDQEEELRKESKFFLGKAVGSIAMHNKEEQRLERDLVKLRHGYWKGLVILQNFIVYLTYRSNGSPKKIIKLIQEFIRVEKPYHIDKNGCFAIGRPIFTCLEESKAYIFFGFDDQYRIGFINHLYRPFLIRYGQSFNKYSDNIILSTTYLLDHLLKFHPFAFSIPNLELTPEVLSTNKTPLLREHIITIIEYLSNNHLRETEIGIFDYKFYSRTQSELIYISKTFEAESAAFNFTLDEGYLIKLHIRAELKSLREVHSRYGNKDQGHSMSLSHLNGILGDLHFFDQEYDEAISAYSDCIKLIGKIDHKLENFIRSQRFRLKLGLTLEKVKSYDDALAHYSDACSETMDFFALHNDSVRRETQPVLNEVLQIANQSFLALIVLQEKMGMDGISLKSILSQLANFNALAKEATGKRSQRQLVQCNMYLVAGNLVYFKNKRGDQSLDRKQLADWGGTEHDESGTEKSDRTDGKNNANQQSSSLVDWDIFSLATKLNHCGEEHCNALPFYLHGLESLLEPTLFETADFGKVDIHRYLREKPDLLMAKFKDEFISKNESKYIAIFLSHIGDCILSSVKQQKEDDWRYNSMKLKNVFVTLNKKDNLDAKTFLDFLQPSGEKPGLIDVLKCYYWSAKFFHKRGRSVSESFQLRKILYVLHVAASAKQPNVQYANLILDVVETLILKPILNIASTTAENSDHHMISKFQHSKFRPSEKDKQARDHFDIFLHNNISNNPDTREALSIFLYLKIKLHKGALKAEYRAYRRFISPDNSFATQYTRIYELNFWGKLNLLMFREFDKKYHANKISRIKTKRQLDEGYYMYGFEYLHAQFSQLLMMDIYGADYTITQSLKGFIHFNIAEFISEWQDHPINIMRFVQFISKHIGFNPMGSMGDDTYHYNMAISHMVKAKQLHTQGHEYRKNMDDLIYLEDDINDNAYHFGAALDRFMLGNETFDTVISKSEQAVNKKKFKNGNISKKYYGEIT